MPASEFGTTRRDWTVESGRCFTRTSSRNRLIRRRGGALSALLTKHVNAIIALLRSFALILPIVSSGFAARLVAQVAGLTGTIVVTNKSISTASIIDVGSGRILATLPP